MAVKVDYSLLDAAIIDSIKSGNDRFYKITGGNVFLIAKGRSMNSPDRVVDRRLQALRKKGSLSFAKGIWTVCEASS